MKKFFHRVTSGESISRICDRFFIPETHLIRTNNLVKDLSDGDLLYIEIPDRKVYRVRPFDTIESVALAFDTTPNKILEDNDVSYIFYGLKIFV